MSRLTHTLIALGYLRRNGEFGKYELALVVLSIGYPLLGNMRIRQILRPFMKELADEVNGSASSPLRDRTTMVYAEASRATQALPRRPDHIGAAAADRAERDGPGMARGRDRSRARARATGDPSRDPGRLANHAPPRNKASATSAHGASAFPTATSKRALWL